MTGFANDFGSLGGKWLELFKEAVPGLTRVANVFAVNEFIANRRNEFRTIMDAAAARLGVTIVTMAFRDAAEIEPAISAFAAAPHGGLLATGAVARAHLDTIERLALHYGLPLMLQNRLEEGVLISHGHDPLDAIRPIASYVDRILRGAKPGDLPIQFPSKFELRVNLKTAKAIGVTIPETFLSRADEVIE
jgi:putative ABC transport system substrate-binding protein